MATWLVYLPVCIIQGDTHLLPRFLYQYVICNILSYDFPEWLSKMSGYNLIYWILCLTDWFDLTADETKEIRK